MASAHSCERTAVVPERTQRALVLKLVGVGGGD